MGEFRVWIDQDLCTGDGLCTEIVPDLFEMHDDDGLAYVKEVTWPSIYGSDKTNRDPLLKMNQTAGVPVELVEDTVEAADVCPGECIFIEAVDD